MLSRSPEQTRHLPNGVYAEPWDARTAYGWAHLADGAGAIVNLAEENIGAGRWTDERKRHILDSRLNAGDAVVQAVEQVARNQGIVIQTSGIGYYGPRQEDEATENETSGQDWVAQIAVQWETTTTARTSWVDREA